MSKSSRRSEELKSLDNEEKQLLGKYQEQLATYYVAQKEIVDKEEDYRALLRETYKKEADIRKHKYRMALRHQNRNSFEVNLNLNEYGDYFLFLNTDDQVLYKYQRRLWTDLQWSILSGLPVGCIFGLMCLKTVGLFKKRSTLDIPLYFMLPVSYWIWCKKRTHANKLFEHGYPAHPTILEKRRKTINQCCFFAPQMVKNEIEYMHAKIDGISSEEDLISKVESNDTSNTIEKTFKTGQVGLKKQEDESKGKEFKIIVEHGELYLECVDSFEEVFEINKKMIDSEKTELTSILDAYLFQNHRDIINAMFEVYYGVGETYMKDFHNVEVSNEIKDAARDRVEKKHRIGKYKEDVIQTIREKEAQQAMSDARQMLKESKQI